MPNLVTVELLGSCFHMGEISYILLGMSISLSYGGKIWQFYIVHAAWFDLPLFKMSS